jgi:hypothetical protein
MHFKVLLETVTSFYTHALQRSPVVKPLVISTYPLKREVEKQLRCYNVQISVSATYG